MALTVSLSREFAIIYGGEVIAYATDFSLEVNKEIVDITKLGDLWKNKVVDKKEFKVSFNGMVTRGDTINLHLWNAETAYTTGQYVTLGGNIYKANSNNTGFNPTTDATGKWTTIGQWSAATTYALNDLIVQGTLVANEARKYKSLQAGNLNHEPTASPSWWERLAAGYESLLNEIRNADIPVKVTIKPNTASTLYWYGSGYITGLSLSVQTGDKSTFSGTFEGTDLITTGTTP